MERDELPVEVRKGHGIVVNERDRAHARARQSLRRKAPHAADTEDGDMAFFQKIDCFVSQKHPFPVKLCFLHNCLPKKELPQGSPFSFFEVTWW